MPGQAPYVTYATVPFPPSRTFPFLVSYEVHSGMAGRPRCVRYRNAWAEGTTRRAFAGLLPERCPGFWCGTAKEVRIREPL